MKTLIKQQAIKSRTGKFIFCNLFSTSDGRYIMAGRTGQHELCKKLTSDIRLAAHWQGFLNNNEAL